MKFTSWQLASFLCSSLVHIQPVNTLVIPVVSPPKIFVRPLQALGIVPAPKPPTPAKTSQIISTTVAPKPTTAVVARTTSRSLAPQPTTTTTTTVTNTQSPSFTFFGTPLSPTRSPIPIQTEQPTVQADAVVSNTVVPCPNRPGYRVLGRSCVDLDECATGTHVCSFAVCVNTIGSYQCRCDVGATWDGLECVPTQQQQQQEPAAMITTSASVPASPRCNAGFSLNPTGTGCVDINECMELPCAFSATCTNTRGSFQCACNSGYTGNGATCTPVPVATIISSCARGFLRNQTGACVDMNECREGTHTCGPLSACVNSRGSFQCVDITPGFVAEPSPVSSPTVTASVVAPIVSRARTTTQPPSTTTTVIRPATTTTTTTITTDQPTPITVLGLGNGLIAGDVFLDRDSNRIVDEGEALSGVQISLSDAEGNAIANAVTSTSGGYVFPKLPTGQYLLRVESYPADTQPSTDLDGVLDGRTVVEIKEGERVVGVDFGFTFNTQTDAKGVIAGSVFLDRDNNGMNDEGEGLAGLIVMLKDPRGNIVSAARTDESGYYVFGTVNPGRYIVNAPTAHGGKQLRVNAEKNNNVGVAVTVAPAQRILGLDFGY